MDCSDSRLQGCRGSGGGECASYEEGPRVGQGDPSRADTGEPPRAALRDVPLFRPGLRGLISLGIGRLRDRPGGRRFRCPSRVPRGPCARGWCTAESGRASQHRSLAGVAEPCPAQVQRGGPAGWGSGCLRHLIPRASEAGVVRCACTARGDGLSRCSSVTCPCAERSRRVRGSARSPMS